MSQDIQKQLAEAQSEVVTLKAQIYDVGTNLQKAQSVINTLQEALSAVAEKVNLHPDENGQISLDEILAAIPEVAKDEEKKEIE